MAVEFSDSFLAGLAGWEAVKQARQLLQQDRVLSSSWAPPLLKGIVQEGSTSYQAGLVIKSQVDVDNICTCRTARAWGAMCAHSVAVGLHYLQSLREAGKAPVTGAASQPRPTRQAILKPSTAVPLARLLRAATPSDGEQAEIHIILPPNFDQAAARGQIMLCFEAKWPGGRAPLNALPPRQVFSFSPADASLLNQIESLAGGATPALLMLARADFVKLLPSLAGHPHLSLGRSTPIVVSTDPFSLKLKAELEASGTLQLSVREQATAPVALGSGWVFHRQTFQPLELPPACADIFLHPVTLSRPEVPRFLSRHWPKLAATGLVEANFRLEDFIFEPIPPKLILDLKGGLAQLEASLLCAYGRQTFNVGAQSSNEDAAEQCWLPDPDSPTKYSSRDPAAEQAALGRLRRAGFDGPNAQGRLRLAGENQVLNFFARDLPYWQRVATVTLEERLEQRTLKNLERIEPQFQITSSGEQWFDLSVAFGSTSGQRLSATEIQRLLLSGQSHTKLSNGKTALVDTDAVEELQEVLLDCAPEQRSGAYHLRATQAGFLEATLREQGWETKAPEPWRQQARAHIAASQLPCPPLGHLETVLRPYQKAGVAWLHFLQANHFGGILADEMGLGKTLQTLAFLLPRPDRRGPALVICPTSLIWNWLAEAQKFTPQFKVLALSGSDRHSQFERIPASDLVVTSYALARRDVDLYRKFQFHTVVLDEAQHIKNRQTQNARAVKSIRAPHRLVLTGTPLENSVLDLWSIFDFLMPGYLGSARDFRDRYELPITQQHAGGPQERLARRLRPFILRRTKQEVAPELPQKIEQVAYCELTSQQRSIYDQLLAAGRSELLAAAGAQGSSRSRMAVLTALLRLRQVCCDPRLLKLDTADVQNASGKLALFNELLDEALDGGHRLLVFSQFVSMLTILRAELETRGIGFCYLDGSTGDRAAVVARFQNNGGIPVFLISLKAGGVGLNLTGADTVIHFDPWWNPAVEDQAVGRAHRIGQTRVVTSYKLIARGTVEEKILALQNRKRDLIKNTLANEAQLAESLTDDELRELLS